MRLELKTRGIFASRRREDVGVGKDGGYMRLKAQKTLVKGKCSVQRWGDLCYNGVMTCIRVSVREKTDGNGENNEWTEKRLREQ
jgi:hypothetical protein